MITRRTILKGLLALPFVGLLGLPEPSPTSTWIVTWGKGNAPHVEQLKTTFHHWRYLPTEEVYGRSPALEAFRGISPRFL